MSIELGVNFYIAHSILKLSAKIGYITKSCLQSQLRT